MDFQTSAKLYTCENLDWAFVQWQNMAVRKCKNTKSLKAKIHENFTTRKLKRIQNFLLHCLDIPTVCTSRIPHPHPLPSSPSPYVTKLCYCPFIEHFQSWSVFLKLSPDCEVRDVGTECIMCTPRCLHCLSWPKLHVRMPTYVRNCSRTF